MGPVSPRRSHRAADASNVRNARYRRQIKEMDNCFLRVVGRDDAVRRSGSGVLRPFSLALLADGISGVTERWGKRKPG